MRINFIDEYQMFYSISFCLKQLVISSPSKLSIPILSMFVCTHFNSSSSHLHHHPHVVLVSYPTFYTIFSIQSLFQILIKPPLTILYKIVPYNVNFHSFCILFTYYFVSYPAC